MDQVIGRTLDEAFVTTVGLHCEQISELYGLYQDIKNLEARDALNSCLKHGLVTEEEGGVIYNTVHISC